MFIVIFLICEVNIRTFDFNFLFVQAGFWTNMAEQIEVFILDEDDNLNNKDNFVGEAAIDKEGLATAVKLSNKETTVNFVFGKEILSEEIILNSLKLRELGDIQIPVSLLVIF